MYKVFGCRSNSFFFFFNIYIWRNFIPNLTVIPKTPLKFVVPGKCKKKKQPNLLGA